MYWQVKNLVAESDIIAIVTVKQLDKKNDDRMIRVDHPNSGSSSYCQNPDYDEFMDVEFLVNDILKADNRYSYPSTLTISDLKGVGRLPKPVSFTVGAKYLVFLEYQDPNQSLQSLRLISPTSGAVQLEGDKTIKKPPLLDGYPPQHREFNEPQLLKRVQELITASIYADVPQGQPNSDFSAERFLLRELLGLPENATDSQIVDLLTSPDKRNAAILLIRYRRIVSAEPKLLEIVKSDGIHDADKLMAAEALCDFGNKEWLPVVKAITTDPNSYLSRTPLKYDAAGLLARAGDFSQFDVVAKGLSEEKDFIKSRAIRQLGNFASTTDPITDTAANFLSDIAKSDKTPRLREYAIESLEKLAKAKPALKEKVIEALEANVNSADESLRTICKVKLTAVYKKSAEPNNTPK
jgi:hypothetical protein